MSARTVKPEKYLSAMHVDTVNDEGLLRAGELQSASNPEPQLLQESIAFVLAKIDRNLGRFTDRFPAPSSVGGVYDAIENVEWTSGFWTGMLWLAYEASGEKRYRDAAEVQVASFGRRASERINVDHHDLGFLYTLSCVSAHKLTGDETAKQAALEAARLLLHRYLPAAGIIQAWGDLTDPAQRGRMIIDCNLNLPLLYWAGEIARDIRFIRAADNHLEQAARHLVRADGSTFHTFYMDAETGRPLYGKTHQGHSDQSCWARGQAWGIYGFALGYRHSRDPQLLRLSQRLANYFLNRLPDDFICCWDLCFTSGSHHRDSSAAAIAACGLLEIASHLPMRDAQRKLYESAAWVIIRALSLNYRTAAGPPENGILRHAVYHMPDRVGVDESCIWGDYFYVEALVRMSRAWNAYW
jgi:unsaturated chondroitin disaccharide hydrolase